MARRQTTAKKSREVQQKLQQMKTLESQAQEFETFEEHIPAIKAFLDKAGAKRYSTSNLMTVFPKLKEAYGKLERAARRELCAYATQGEPREGMRFGKTAVVRPWEWHAPIEGRKPLETSAAAAPSVYDARLTAIEQQLAAIQQQLSEVLAAVNVNWTAT